MNKLPQLFHVTMIFGMALTASLAGAAGIIPECVNQIIVQGDFAGGEPDFLLICSAFPLRDAEEKPLHQLSAEALHGFRSNGDQVVVRLHGKKPTGPNRVDYFFGTRYDPDMPWNNGVEFHWKDWEKYSPDVWDNVCLAVFPQIPGQATAVTTIKAVTMRLGGNRLFDSRITESFSNQKSIQTALAPTHLTPQNGIHPLLNLSERMIRFRKDFYELGQNPILQLAYSDLGQTDRRKYARRGTAWCTEFASYIYRVNGIPTPDPDKQDVFWRNMREFFEQHGRVYPAREVATWPDEKKLALITPGSFVAVAHRNASTKVIEATHSLIFTTWVTAGERPITRWAGISGNRKQGQVFADAARSLPDPGDTAKMSAELQKEMDQIEYFAVLAERQAADASALVNTAYTTEIGPLLNTQWGQRGVYAKLTPTGVRTGCWAAALAQILYYHRVQPSGEVTYWHEGGQSNMVVALDRKFDWSLFVDSLSETTSKASQDEVATYCYYTFLATNEMVSAPTSVHPKTPFSDLARAGLKKYFNCSTSRVSSRDAGGVAAVEKTIVAELSAKRPLMLYAHPHAFVIDGVRIGEKGFEIHLNCGWNGKDNGWYVFEQPFPTHFGPLGGTDRWVMLIRPPASGGVTMRK